MPTNTSSCKSTFLAIFRPFLAIFFILNLISCATILPDCNVCSSPPLNALDGQWELVRWNLPPQAGQVKVRNIPQGDKNPPIRIQFNFEKKLLSGYSGCNTFLSHLTEGSKNAIVLGKISTTRKSCESYQQNYLERDFLNILNDYRSWQQNKDQLLLLGREGDVLVFSERNQ